MDIDSLIARGETLASGGDNKSPKAMIWKKDVKELIAKNYGREYVKILEQLNHVSRMARNASEATQMYRERTARVVDFLKELQDIPPTTAITPTDTPKVASGDELKDAIIQYLYDEQHEHPTRGIGWPKYTVTRELSSMGHDESDISFAFDFLEDEGYFKSTTDNKVKYYRLSSKALGKILPPSSYARKKGEGIPRILNNGGVVILGDNYGAINIQDRSTIIEKVEAIEVSLLENDEVDEYTKLDARESAETIKAQLRRKEPDFSIIGSAWASFQEAANIQPLSNALKEVEELFEQLAQD